MAPGPTTQRPTPRGGLAYSVGSTCVARRPLLNQTPTTDYTAPPRYGPERVTNLAMRVMAPLGGRGSPRAGGQWGKQEAQCNEGGHGRAGAPYRKHIPSGRSEGPVRGKRIVEKGKPAGDRSSDAGKTVQRNNVHGSDGTPSALRTPGRSSAERAHPPGGQCGARRLRSLAEEKHSP